MTVVEPGKRASFMVACRTNYFNDIRPSDPGAKRTGGYSEAVAIAKTYFKEGRAEAFRTYLVEAKYLADLWAAHLLLEYGKPDALLMKECLDLIERYAASTFDVALAREEQIWLKEFALARQATV